MSVTARAKNEAVGTGTSPTVVEPVGAANGDVLLAFALCAVAGAITRPAGWSPLYVGTGTSVMWDVSWIRRGETAPSLTWGVTGSVYREVYVVCLQRQNGDGPILLHAQSASGVLATSTAAPDAPPVTTTAPTAFVVCGGVNFAATAGATWTAPAGYTLQTANAASSDGIMASKPLLAAGIEDPAIFTTSAAPASGDLWNGFTVAFTDVPLVVGSTTNAPATIKKRLVKSQRMDD